MKKTHVIRWSLLGLVLALSVGYFGGCSYEDPTEDFQIRVTMDPVETTWSIAFRDQESGQMIEAPLTVTFLGPDRDQLGSIINEPVSDENYTYTSANGTVNFALLLDAQAPTQQDPIQFAIRVEDAQGEYMTETRSYTVTQTGNYQHNISLLNLNDAPDGVEVSRRNEGRVGAGGEVVEPIDFETDPEPETGVRTRLELPAGTIVRDENGTPLTGDLTTTAVYYSPTASDGNALPYFPGGLNGVEVEGETGYFVTAGFVALTVEDENGTEAATFENGALSVTQEMPEGLMNPETNQPVQAGDTVPIFSYDEETDTWSEEGQGTAVMNGDGLLEIQWEAEHLSWWNLDWFGGDYCYEIYLFLENNNFCDWLYVEANFAGDDGLPDPDMGYLYDGYIWGGDDMVGLNYVPAGEDMYWRFYYGSSVVWEGVIYVEVNEDDECEDVYVVFEDYTGDPTIDVTVQAEFWCPDDPDVRIYPSLDVYLYRNDPFYWGWTYGGYVYEGYIEFYCLWPGYEYGLGTWYQGDWYQQFQVIDDTRVYQFEYELDQEFCDENGF